MPPKEARQPRRHRETSRPRVPAHRTAPAPGFSLIELMVVLTVAGILLTVAVPNFLSLTSRDRVETAAYDVHHALVLARQKALAKRATYRLTILPGGTALRIERRQGTDWIADPSDDIVLHEQVQLASTFAGDPENTDLLIEPQGTIRAEDAPAEFFFTNQRADSATVRMVRTGRIRTWTH
ncbi:MAG: prepilin-type N-terminal cleavage/methylation domain-containing protein [Candidatus Eisenbacteria sp.]|nr:prepilin-type N-terminal cleavage/methylation domain-containing protein [Candidatus Eisenbacteria bacterium]